MEGRKARGQLSTDRRNRNSSPKEIRLNVSGSLSKNSGWTSYWTVDFTVINCIKLATICIKKESKVSQSGEEARGPWLFSLAGMQLKPKKSQIKGT